MGRIKKNNSVVGMPQLKENFHRTVAKTEYIFYDNKNSRTDMGTVGLR